MTHSLDALTAHCTAFNSFEALSEAITKGYTPTLRLHRSDTDTTKHAVLELRNALQVWGLPVYPSSLSSEDGAHPHCTRPEPPRYCGGRVGRWDN